MSRAALQNANTESQKRVSVDGPVGVIDIGSNSVRLVIYEAMTRNPAVVFNEKTLCGIGRNMVSTGRLDQEGMEAAIMALARFRIIAEQQKVSRIDTVATAAVRDAKNGNEFVALARDTLGAPIRVLTGEQEARMAAEGVIAAIPDADGLVGDLGGGSLEIVGVSAGATGQGYTLPVGPLRLMDSAAGKVDRARAIVDEGLSQITGLDKLKGRSIYAVGGVWRNIARIHMTKIKHPIKILHQYSIARDEAVSFMGFIAGLSRRSLEDLSEVSRKRAEGLPFGAVVMERLLRATKADRMVVSAFGLREGVLFSRMSDAVKAQDPLIAYCQMVAQREAREPDLDDVLMHWTQGLLHNETAEETRLRRACCILSDTAWRAHPDHRANLVFMRALNAPLIGIDHRARAWLAMTLYYRYAGEEEAPEHDGKIHNLLGPEGSTRALIFGLGLRLALSIAGAARQVLKDVSLKVTQSSLVLNVPQAYAPLIAEPVIKRLVELGNAMGKTARIETK